MDDTSLSSPEVARIIEETKEDGPQDVREAIERLENPDDTVWVVEYRVLNKGKWQVGGVADSYEDAKDIKEDLYTVLNYSKDTIPAKFDYTYEFRVSGPNSGIKYFKNYK